MAVTMGGLATALAGYQFTTPNAEGTSQSSISERTSQVISLTLLPTAIVMVAYASFAFYFRSKNLRTKQVIRTSFSINQAAHVSLEDT